MKPEPLKGKWKPRGQMALSASDSSLVCPGVLIDIKSAVEWLKTQIMCFEEKDKKYLESILEIAFEDVIK